MFCSKSFGLIPPTIFFTFSPFLKKMKFGTCRP